MVINVSVSEAKAGLSSLVAGVAEGRRVVVHRRGEAVAALVSPQDLEIIERERPTAAQPQGALVLIGAWSEVEEREADALLADIYARRSEDTGRPVKLES